MNYGEFFVDADYEEEDYIHNEKGEFTQQELYMLGCNF